MVRVLVTGGTGMLGRRLVPLLVERGHAVRLLARRAASDRDEVEALRGDVRTGEGLDPAVRGVDAVVHAATSPRRHARKTEVLGTRNVLNAISHSGSPVHLIYVSIVGVDRNRFPYYKAKREAERVVESSGMGWSIQRATQFHDLLDQFLSGRVFVRTPNLSFQVVDAGEVAGRLADLVEAGPNARAPDFGGPQVLNIRELASARREATGRAARLIPVPPLGPLRDFDAGHHLCPDHRSGRTTWRQWLATTGGDAMKT
ncbi:MAG: SDR family oxidoreductase [Acidimicrobiales bacterium]